MSIGTLRWGKIPGRGVLSSKLPTYTRLGLNHLLVCLPPSVPLRQAFCLLFLCPQDAYTAWDGGVGGRAPAMMSLTW